MRERLRRLRFPLAIAAVVVLVAAVLALAGGGAGGALDPDSAAPGGSRALARILDAQGVSVKRVRDPEQALGENGTVVVVHPELLTPDQLRLLVQQQPRLVLVEPDATVLSELAPAVEPAGEALPGLRDPGCGLAEATAGPARGGGRLYTLTAGNTGDVCFHEEGDGPAGALVSTVGVNTTQVFVLGQGDVLTNAHLDEDANAALALRVLGARPTLTWIVPDPLQATPDGGGSLTSLLPLWVRWVVVQLGLAVLLTLLWRGRRLGPVVREPLPVAVRSAETLLGRARLYRRARAVDRAAATLRTAVLRRLAARLAVPPASGPAAVAVRVAETSGQDADRVRRVLLGPPPADERGLVALADDLDALERSLPAGGVRSTPGAHPDSPPDRSRHDQQREDQA